jgi:DNA-binding response OmpR family regulator
MVAREPLALVVTDLRLSDGDGLDIVRAARRTSPKPTPALVVTGFASEASRTASLAAGASGYLAKPFGAAALVALIEGTLGARPDL